MIASEHRRLSIAEKQRLRRAQNWDHVRSIEKRSHEKHSLKRSEYRKRRWIKDREKMLEYYRNYRATHKEEITRNQERYSKKNNTEILAKGRAKYHATLESQHARSKKYHATHKDRARRYAAEYKMRMTAEQKVNNLERRRLYKQKQQATNPAYRIVNNCRSKVYLALKRIGSKKSENTLDLLGCSPQFFKDFLEHQFNKHMNWDNYGWYWNIDHVIPVSKFDLLDEIDRKRAFHYSNCKPMLASKNFQKFNSLPPAHQPFLI